MKYESIFNNIQKFYTNEILKSNEIQELIGTRQFSLFDDRSEIINMLFSYFEL